jgi:hypothetical protein
VTEAVTDGRSARRLRRTLIVIVIVLLPVAAHAIWDQVEASRLAARIADLQRRGEPVNLLYQRDELPTEAERNAARFYAAAADLAKWRAAQAPGLWDAKHALDTADRAAARDARTRWVDGEPALQLLDAATPLDFGGFSYVSSELQTNGSALTTLNTLNCVRADVLSIERQPAAALSAIMASLRLERTLPAPFYDEVSASRTFESLRLLLGTNELPEPLLKQLEDAFATALGTTRSADDLRLLRARLLGDFWPYGPVPFSWALRGHVRVRGGLDTITSFCLRPLITWQLRETLDAFDEAIDAARLPWPANLEAAEALARKYGVDLSRRPPAHTVRGRLGMFSPAIAARTVNVTLRSSGSVVARRRIVVATLAIERYRRDHTGALPSALDALVPQYVDSLPVDPFSGAALHYVHDPEHYAIYSIGPDRSDSGGTRDDLAMRVPVHPRN